MNRFLSFIAKKRVCWKLGHIFRYEGETLGGDLIKCTRCDKLDEFLPGVHEPNGYDYTSPRLRGIMRGHERLVAKAVGEELAKVLRDEEHNAE